MAITDSWLKANHNKATGAVSEKADRDGLSIRISAKGKITFQIRYRYQGKAKRLDLGSYPLMSLKEARIANMEYRAELEKNIDPAVSALLKEQAIYNDRSLSVLFYDWYESECIHDVVRHEPIKDSFELHVLPKLGKLPASKITLHHWLDFLKPHVAERPQIASRILTQTKKLYKWAKKREYLEVNPLSDIYAKGDLKIRRNKGKRVLSDDEIKLLWLAFRYSAVSIQFKLLIKLCLFFGCRVGELKYAEKADFDFDEMIWTVPANKHKTGGRTDQPIIRPIIERVVPTLEDVIALSNSDTLLFTKIRTNEALSESGHLDIPVNLTKWINERELRGKEPISAWSTHDLRRTMRTNMSSITSRQVAEIMIAHAQPEMDQVYDHHKYLNEQREAYNKWFDRLESLVGNF